VSESERKGRRKATRNVKVAHLARVEGEGALDIKIKGNEVTEAKLRIFEPPRFFEAFLRGRAFTEVPDITARICGICPVAYQMSSCQAMENAAGVSIDGTIGDLRRLLYCGEWIQSHVLHVYMLHAPDFLGYESAIHVAKDHPEIVERGLRLKKIGNEIMEVVGGRAVHPINVRVGGFYKAPGREKLAGLLDELRWAREASLETVRWVAGFDYPDLERDYHFVALRHEELYPFDRGRLVSNRGLDIAVDQFSEHFTEEHVEHSNALHCRVDGGEPYFVGPMARYNLNFDLLSDAAREAALEAGLGDSCTNPFKSIIVRAVETLYACDEAIRIIESYEPPERAWVETPPRPATGHGCTEAPRGILYHRYRIDGGGAIEDAVIIPPTSQNQPTIEGDLRQFVSTHLDLPDDRLQWQCEQAVRNYDPCISCATHSLKLTIERD
jgi:coenzyme F420-reducing hydrogenase alpha subunit